jgi:sigma-B regulation protein RsbU (phosphoserine phosphatase)
MSLRFLRSFSRNEAVLEGHPWLPFLLVFGSIAAVAYADFVVISISLGYLYFLPLGLSAMFLRRQVSYALVALCVCFHDMFGPPYPNTQARIVHNMTALVGFAFVVYLIQTYVKQRESLAKEVRLQRDELLRDVELAAQVQRMFLPPHPPSIAGLEIAGMMQPAKAVGGDYYDYIPIDEGSIELVVADVTGKGVPAALLMSVTAAAVQAQAGENRDMLEIVHRLNTAIHSVSDDVYYVTLVLADIDVRDHSVRYVNCGHNPALLFHSLTQRIISMNSSGPPVGIFENEVCEVSQAKMSAGDFLVLYTDGLTDAESVSGEPFGLDRLSDLIRQNSSLSAEKLMQHIFENAAKFCQKVGFNDDVTIVVAKCTPG